MISPRKVLVAGARQKLFPKVSVSVSTFVPKPHTPFQWESQVSLEEMKERLALLRDEARRSRLNFKWQDPHLSYLEGIFSVGDRDLSRVLIEAHRLGCRFDGWSDQFDYGKWRDAFEKAGVEMGRRAGRKRLEETLPWSFIETGVEPRFLWEEYQKGLKEETSPPCSGKDCRRCGVCDGMKIRLISHPAEPEVFGRKERRGSRNRGIRQKIRLKFKKRGQLRFLSHLELAHLFYRASRRAGLPLCYSEGFHPMPKIIFARALPVGVESLMETVDIELDGKVNPPDVKERLNRVLTEGVEVMEAEEVLPSSPASSLSPRSVYWVTLDQTLSKEEVTARIGKAFESSELFIDQERKGKKRSVDIRPLIERMEVVSSGQDASSKAVASDARVLKEDEKGQEEKGSWGIELTLRNVAGKTAKASEVVEAILGLKAEALSRSRILKIE